MERSQVYRDDLVLAPICDVCML